MDALLKGVRAGFSPTARGFARNLQRPAIAQQRVLATLVRELAASDYGRHLGVRTPEDFVERVPVVSYEDLEPWLNRQRAGQPCVLGRERVRFYEPTSGSSGARKLIPYTRGLQRSFGRMFRIWVHDLLRDGPSLHRGKFYFSVSPKLGQSAQSANPPKVGLRDDRDYLGPALRFMLSPFVVNPTSVSQCADGETFRRRTAELLLLQGDLEIISIWNPTFLTVLLAYIEAHRAELLRATSLRGPRAAALGESRPRWEGVWPELRLISCWTEGAARGPADRLRSLFPNVSMQGKGLLATEAPITVPIIRSGGCVPLVDEVYLELLDEAGSVMPLTDGCAEREYELVVSQRGGLYRYRIGDRVKVGARFLGTRMLEFIGRGEGVSDLVGEKLQAQFLRSTLAELGVEPTAFYCVLPCRHTGDHYVCVTDRPPPGWGSQELDAALSKAHHYRLARELGQLRAARVVVRGDAAEALFQHELRRGLKAGDIKHRTLWTQAPDAQLQQWLDTASSQPQSRQRSPP